MASPVWSRPTPTGAYEFGMNDGSTTLLPPTPAVKEADAGLPNGPDTSTLSAAVEGSDPLAGATAGNPHPAGSDAYYDYESTKAGYPPGSDPYGAPAGAPPTATDAVPSPTGGSGGMHGGGNAYTPPARDGGSMGAPSMSAEERAAATELVGPTQDTPAAGTSGGLPNYIPNPNEGGGVEAPRPSPVRVHTVKGGPRTAQWTFSGREVPEEAREMAMDALDTGDMANQIEAQEESKAHQDRIAQARATDAALAQRDEDAAKVEASRVKSQADRLAALDAEISNLETEVNPDRYWDNKSTFTKILFGIALFASGATARGGQSDVVGDAIDKAITRDIEAQKQSIKNRKDKSKARQTLYGRFVEHYGDERKAELAVRAAYDRQVARNFEIQAAQTKDPARASQLMKGRADYLAKSAATMMELDGRNVTETVVNVPDRTFTTGGGARKSSKGESDKRARNVPGYGLAPTGKEGAEGRELIANTNDVLDTIARIKALTASVGDRVLPGKEKEAAKSEVSSLLMKLNRQEKLGALDAGSTEVLGRRMGDPLSWTDFGGRTAGLDAVAEQVQRGARNRLNSMGITPATREMTPDGPSTSYTGAQPYMPRKPTPVSGFTGAGK